MTAMRCSAALSWRLPPRARRWRFVRPEEAGIGATPACIAKHASWRNRVGLPVSATIFAAVSDPAARQLQQGGCLRADQAGDLALEGLLPAGQVGDVVDQVPADPYLRGLRQPAEPRRSGSRSFGACRSGTGMADSRSGSRSCRCQRSRFIDPGPLPTRSSR